MGRPDVAIIIPAYNEEASIAQVTKSALRYGRVFVVDDGSRDETAEVARENGANVVSHQRNCGYESALQTGIEAAVTAGAEIILTIDADGQHNIDDLDHIINLLTSGSNVFVGVRPSFQRWSEILFGWLGARLWGIRDPLCGLKGYRREVLNWYGRFDTYRSIGTELALTAAASGIRIDQMPIKVNPRFGSSRFGGKIKANIRILRAIILALHYCRRSRAGFRSHLGNT